MLDVGITLGFIGSTSIVGELVVVGKMLVDGIIEIEGDKEDVTDGIAEGGEVERVGGFVGFYIVNESRRRIQ